MQSSESKDKNIYGEQALNEYQSVRNGINDPVLLIIRIHLYAEYLMERLIHCQLPRGDRLIDNSKMAYTTKLNIVASFDTLSDVKVSFLRQLNKVRNECAHELHKTITKFDIDRIGSPFGKAYTKIRKESKNNDEEVLNQVLTRGCGEIAGSHTDWK